MQSQLCSLKLMKNSREPKRSDLPWLPSVLERRCRYSPVCGSDIADTPSLGNSWLAGFTQVGFQLQRDETALTRPALFSPHLILSHQHMSYQQLTVSGHTLSCCKPCLPRYLAGAGLSYSAGPPGTICPDSY